MPPLFSPLLKIDDAKVTQDIKGYHRICYGNENGDLFIWLDEKNQKLARFELSFYTSGDDRKEFVVYWDGGTLKTGTVDSKEVDGRKHDLKTPVIQPFLRKDKAALAGAKNFLKTYGSNLPAKLFQSLLAIIKRIQ